DYPSLDEVEVLRENTVEDSEIQLKSVPSGSEYINVTPLASNDSSSIQPSTLSPIGKIQARPSTSVTSTPTQIAFGCTTKSPHIESSSLILQNKATLYCSMVGSLMYFYLVTQPDLGYAIHIATYRMNEPR
ncbi:hypothetical protein HK096_001180, partial [Nowakowskiella sp. JEL0078]